MTDNGNDGAKAAKAAQAPQAPAIPLLPLRARALIRILLRPAFKGLEHLVALPSPGIILSNRTSLADAALVCMRSPNRLTLVLDEAWARHPMASGLAKVADILPVDLQKPIGPQGVADALASGARLLLFPELVPTRAQSITEVSEEAGRFLVDSGLPVTPVILDGPQYSRWGVARGLVRNLPKDYPTQVTFFPPQGIPFAEREHEGRPARARRCADAVYGVLKELRFQAKECDLNLWTQLGKAAKRYGPGRPIVEDVGRKPLSYRGLLWKARLLAVALSRLSSRSENVGLLLPNGLHAVVCLFALWSSGRVPVYLNHGQGAALLNSAMGTAGVRTVISSRAFVKEYGIAKTMAALKAEVRYIEDFSFGLGDRVAAFLRTPAPAPPGSPAVIVFTSGSEGKPKGVVHSHRGLLSNQYQTTCHLEYSEDDVFFDPMPLFHTIGLNMLLLTPILQGMYSFLYPNPLHPHRIPKLIYELGATMVVASDTFANAWAREAHPRDFSSLRILLAGSERIKEKTHERFFRDHGLRLYEGYGVSETAPVLAVSTQMHFRQGPCGRFLPGIRHRLMPVEGIGRGGILHVRGPNVMLGYLVPGRPGELQAPPGGWHDTGDIVEVDEDGYVWIMGRHKRFAKIGGEMVSLVAVEEVVNQLWPGRPQAVMAVPDEQRGERLVLVTEEPTVDVVRLRDGIREAGLPEIAVPRQFVTLDKIPLNPVGKLNFPELQVRLEKELARIAALRDADPA
ncbi:MAG: AMP-binding protein [Deltaproteobacteria bacterium]|jgi:acyl-[acyl-carrier-protein]-phospholipid O-acyltransferase/long-chain-fatty-acid--[acyl-carrier-protein] ligase|nr:AMP-binding protein [Deltaproteobacteria bacterium]